ncbi:hypothetical protein F4779DRAFT_565817 [Xylariaceae sp. FL0662B]|nr:hypothetical protein F4779DRAFT_565817 [Xylariaceae sp. FL0662B]
MICTRINVTHCNCGELVAEEAAASAEIPGSWAIDAVVEVELGRDIGSRVTGNGVVPSSMTARIGGNAGDDVRVGIGAIIGGRLFARYEKASVDAVLTE